MGKVDLNTLVLFAKVVEARSFSGGARRLRMPLSTLSRRVSELEEQLGTRLLDRSTRKLRLTPAGAELLEHAQRAADLSDTVTNVASYRATAVAGTLRISAVPSISDTLLAPIVGAYQERYPDVRVQVLVTERVVDHIEEGVDLFFRIRVHKTPSLTSLVTQKLLSYRHRLVASPAYLAGRAAPESPSDLLGHRLLAFCLPVESERTWRFTKRDDSAPVTFQFQPHLAMNDFAGLAAALEAGMGIGDLPPVVRPDLIRDGKLVEVMPRWEFERYTLQLVSNSHSAKHVVLFKRLALEMAPRLFPDLPR
jgi:DNA-binding transcriptional LysR family regulator